MNATTVCITIKIRKKCVKVVDFRCVSNFDTLIPMVRINKAM